MLQEPHLQPAVVSCNQGHCDAFFGCKMTLYIQRVLFNYGLVNDFLLEWNKKKIELSAGKITPEEYFEWKIKFPE